MSDDILKPPPFPKRLTIDDIAPRWRDFFYFCEMCEHEWHFIDGGESERCSECGTPCERGYDVRDFDDRL